MSKEEAKREENEVLENLLALGKDLSEVTLKQDKKIDKSTRNTINKLWLIDKESSKTKSVEIKKFFSALSKLKSNLTEKKPVKIDRFENFLIKLGIQLVNGCSVYKRLHKLEPEKFDLLTKSIEEFQEYHRPSISTRKACLQVVHKNNPKSKTQNFYYALSEPNEKFIVSDGFLYDAFPYFDFWLDNNDDKERILKTYRKKIKELLNSTKLETLCFITKRYGGNGPFSVLDDLEKIMGVDCATVEQLLKIGKDGKTVSFPEWGIKKVENKNIVILYDLSLTQRGIEEAFDLLHDNKGKVLGVVLLHRYSKPKEDFSHLINKNDSKFRWSIISEDYEYNSISLSTIFNKISKNYPYLETSLWSNLGTIIGGFASLGNSQLTSKVEDKFENIAFRKLLYRHVNSETD